MEVEMVGVRRCLAVAFLERFSMPYAVTLVDEHMIHVDRDPDVACCVGYLVVDVVVYDEVVGPGITILDIVYSRLCQLRKVEPVVIVLVIVAPVPDLARIRKRFGSVGLDSEHFGCLF